MFMVRSQDGSFTVPYDTVIMRLTYRKRDEDTEEEIDTTKTSSKTITSSGKVKAAAKKKTATSLNPKRYMIDFYPSGYEDVPILMGEYKKDSYRDYVVKELDKNYNNYLKAMRGELLHPTDSDDHTMVNLKNLYTLPSNDTVAKLLAND